MQHDYSVFVLQVVFLWIFHYHWTSASTYSFFPIDICPKNEFEVEEASERLNCSHGYDENKNEYHCVPISNFTELVEFCYPKISGLIGKGLCMVLSGNTLDARECRQFQDGCPDILYTSETMYQFPACSQINRESKCYLADPSCPPLWQSSSTINHNTTTERNIPMDTGTEAVIIIIVIFIPISLLVLSTFAYFMFRRRQRRYENGTIDEAENLVKKKDKESKDIPMENSISVTKEDEEIDNYAKDDKFRKRFQQYLEEGSVDVSPISQIIIVGENGVGKTTLLYRLQGRSQEEIDQIQSTKGVDCHTQKFGFIVTNGQLKMNKEVKSNLAVTPERVLAGGLSTGITKEVISCHSQGTSIQIANRTGANESEEEFRGDEDTFSYKSEKKHQMRKEENVVLYDRRFERERANNLQGKKFRSDEDTFSYKSEKRHQMIKEEHVHLYEMTFAREGANNLQAGNMEEIHSSASEETTSFGSYKQPIPDENTNMNTQVETFESVWVSEVTDNDWTTKLMSNVEQKLADARDIRTQLRNENDVVLNVLDFAGQGAYYASHQTYMRKDAIYIVVFDVSRDLDEGKGNKDSMMFADDRTYLCDRPHTSFSCWGQKDYIHYWLNTIRVHGGNCKNIILVGTHGDSKRIDFESKYKELLKNITGLLPEKRCEVIIDLSRMSKEEEIKLKHIEAYICKTVSKSERNLLPAKWMKFEGAFDIMKSQKPVITIDDLLQIIDQTEPEMWDVEIHDMLRYFHENGSILFFNMDNLREIIILDIQWFIDCFKHIITDREHAKEENGMVNKDVQEKWNLFFEKGILVSSFYEDLMHANTAKLPREHRKVLGDYQQKLGMMLYIERFEISDKEVTNVWYIPCVNTEQFEPDKEKYCNIESSPILCFRFEDYLPLDLFGRMIVLCLSSGKWRSFGKCFYKEGAHMIYDEIMENKQDPIEVYLFTSRRIITVQVINQPETQQHGGKVKAEIQNVIHELLSNFYACLRNCEIGFLCSKNEGYKESSVEHFIQMTAGSTYCHVCKNVDDVKHEIKRAHLFWNVFPKQDYTSNENESVGGERQWITVCYQFYLKVLEKVLIDFDAEKNMGFGSFFTSLLKTGDSITTTAAYSHLDQDSDREAKMKKLDRFIDIGMKLKHLSKTSRTNNGNKKENIAEIKDIAYTLKKISLGFDDKHGHFRRNLFFSWTNNVGDIQQEDIDTIPEIYLTVPNLRFGDDVKLEASVDVDVCHFIWLKKNDPKNKFEIIGKPTSGQKRKDSHELNNFSKDDEGQYQLIVATKQTVGRRIFQLKADPLHTDLDHGLLPLLYQDRRFTEDATGQQIKGFPKTILVAAIDFGTILSGYAFSFCGKFDKNHSKIGTNFGFSSFNRISHKTSSVVLLNPKKKFHAFGYEAERKYTEEDQQEEWFYFKHFKMTLLQNKSLNRTTTIEDVNGKAMSAMTIFTMAIKYLKDHLMEKVNLMMLNAIPEDCIFWVVTVSTICDKSAKQFMAYAAAEAGIPKEQLFVVSEPEAATNYFNHTTMEVMSNEKDLFKPGTQYMVLDLGGTVDITVNEVQLNRTLRNVHHQAGKAWRGITVDDAFYQFLEKLFGKDVLKTFKNEYQLDYIELFDTFEMRKREFRPDSGYNIRLPVPLSLLEIFETKSLITLEEALQQAKYANSVRIRRDKLQVHPEIFKEFFSHTLHEIIQHITDMLQSIQGDSVSKMFLVGGLSESPMVLKAIREFFPNKIVIASAEPELAILKGAVMVGQLRQVAYETDTI